MKKQPSPLRVPYALTVYGKEEINAVVKVLQDPTKIVPGNQTRLFESKIAELFGKKYGIMVNSGSSANLLAIKALNLPEGSEVITPILTFSTTVAPLIQERLIPVFADVEIGTYTININHIKKLISKKTKALMIPSLIGNIPNLAKIKALARRHRLYVVEDSCDTLGARYQGKPTGVYSDISTTSFYASHIITAAGGGGMVCVNNETLAKRIMVMRGWGRNSSLFNESESLKKRFSAKIGSMVYDSKFIFSEIGFNFQTIELCAAFGLVQLERLTKFAATRKWAFKKLHGFFLQYEKYFVLPQELPGVETSWLAFPLTIKTNAPFTRLELTTYLEEHNIQTRPIFTGNILKQPGFKKIQCRTLPGGYPAADQIMQNSFLIGCHHGMEVKHVQYLTRVFQEFIDQHV